MIDPSHAQVVERHLLELLELPPAARRLRLDALCDAMPAAADELRERCRLLESFEAPHDFVELSGPAQFGQFTLLRQLGGGGMGLVYLAEYEAAGVTRRIALKILRPGVLGGAQARERLRREARAAARLDHSALCPVYDVGEVDGTPYIAMRHVPGETLASVLTRHRRERRPLSLDDSSESTGTSSRQRPRLERIAALIEHVARGLQVAHDAGLVHRDVKPGNIMVTPEGQAVLLDFGIVSDAAEDGDRLTVSGAPIGTPAYMAPEQVRGSRIEASVDVYGLGATLYECLTLSQPFLAETRESLYYAILHDDPRDVRTLAHGVPRDLAVIVATAMHKEPRRRYASALAFAEDLRRWRENLPICARAPGPFARLTLWSKRNPFAASALCFALAATPLVVWQWTRASAERDRALANLADARAAVRELNRTAIEDLAEVPHIEPLRRQLLERGLEFHRRFLVTNADLAQSRRDVAESLWYSGSLLVELSRLTEAVQCLREARAIAAELPDGAALLRSIETQLGRTLASLGEFDEAETLLARAIDEHSAAVDAGTEADEALARVRLASAQIFLAEQQLELGRIDEAEQGFARAERELRHAATAQQVDRDRLLGIALQFRAGIDFNRGRTAEAFARFDAAIESLRVGERGKDRHALAAALNLQGHCYARTGDYTAARKAYEHALEILEPFVRDRPETTRFATLEAAIRVQLAAVLMQLGERDESLRQGGLALVCQERLAAADPANLAAQVGLVVALYGRARALGHEPNVAIDLHRRAVAHARKLLESHPDHVKLHEAASSAANSLSVHLWDMGDRDASLAALDLAIGHARTLTEQHPLQHGYRASLAHRLAMRGSRALELDDRENGIPLLEESLQRRLALAAEHPEIAHYGVDVVNGFSRFVRPAHAPDAITRLAGLLDWLTALPPEVRARYAAMPDFDSLLSWLLVRCIERATPLTTYAARAVGERALAMDPDNAALRELLGTSR